MAAYATNNQRISAGGARRVARAGRGPQSLSAALGAPIGAVAAFLGVGGSVMTVPAMRRAGHTLHVMSAPANLSPWPSRSRPPRSRSAAPRSAGAHIHLVHLVGLVAPSAAAALLVGALPVIEVLRRRPSRILDRSYAWAHVGLPTVAVAAMLLSGVSR
ncbi:hypothetical protein ACFVRD_40360 [Streptomyces sp. NPDC057908]|uniref:hypothetical protein n=1 Tax=Streptomyces sp. NPDC057908 TaxID=3346276 RepID=UPI0036E515FC